LREMCVRITVFDNIYAKNEENLFFVDYSILGLLHNYFVIVTQTMNGYILNVIFLFVFCCGDPWAEQMDDVERSINQLSNINKSYAKYIELLEYSINKENYPYLHTLVTKWGQVCSYDKHNIILARADRLGYSNDRLAPWTMAVEVARFSSELKNVTSTTLRNTCGKVHSFLASIGRGERICALDLPTPPDMCSALFKYQRIYMWGDSLTRHMLMGMNMLMSGDLQRGAVQPEFGVNYPFEKCQCDGIFSEHDMCRKYLPHKMGLSLVQSCKRLNPDFPSLDMKYLYKPRDTTSIPMPCIPYDRRPLLVFLQALRSYSIPAEAFGYALERAIRLRDKHNAMCGENRTAMHIVFTGTNVQSRGYDARFPKQSRKEHLIQNIVFHQYLSEKHPEVVILDFYNLTMIPPADSSDGAHYLTATNVEKAAAFVRLLDMLAAR
jgi:hypothetical protein